MKKLLIYIYIVGLFVFFGNFLVNAELSVPPSGVTPSKILSNDIGQIINKTITDSKNPIRDGASEVAKNLNLADDKNTKITDINSAIDTTGNIIKRVINYLLGFLAFVALIYLLYYGYLLLFGALDDSSSKKTYAALRNAAIAIIGIGLSWLIVQLAFWIVSLITK